MRRFLYNIAAWVAYRLQPKSEDIQGLIERHGLSVEEILKEAAEIHPQTYVMGEQLSLSRTWSSFSGCDIKFFLSTIPPEKGILWTDWLDKSEVMGTAQGATWHIESNGFSTVKLMDLVLDDPVMPKLEGKYLSALAANEHGSAAWIACFLINKYVSTSSGTTVDSTVLERVHSLECTHMPKHIRKVEMNWDAVEWSAVAS